MQTITKTILTGLIFIITIYAAKSQNTFEEGYIINNAKDTIYGMIANNDFSSNSLQCKFKSRLDAKVEEFVPFDIHSYRFVNGKYYISKNVLIENKDVSLFLEFLIKGKLNIYFTRYKGVDYYFVEKEKDSLIYLDNSKIYYEYDDIKKEWVVSENETLQKVGYSNQYKGKLLYVTSDVPEMRSRVSQLNLSHKSIIKFSKDYHNKVCDNEECIVFEKKSAAMLSVGATISYPYFQYGNAHTTIDKPFKFNQISFPGFFILAQSGIIHENVQLKASFYFDKVDEQVIDENQGASLKGLGVTIPTTMQYTMPFKIVKPYANAGLVIHFLNKPEFHRLVLSDGEITGKSLDALATTNYKRLNIGGSFSAGINIPVNNIVIDMGASYDLYFSSKSLRILRPYISIGYVFK